MDANTAAWVAGLVFATFIFLGWAEKGQITFRLLWEAVFVALLSPRLLPLVGYLILFLLFETLNLASYFVEAFFALLAS